MHFRPYPGLTVFTVISLAILLSLGTWQYQRLGWKTDLVARIDTASGSAPFTSGAQILSARSAKDPIDFRRVSLKAQYETGYDGAAREYHVYKSKGGKTHWRIFRAASLSAVQSVFVAGELVSDGAKDVTRPVTGAPVYISGYVRTWQNPSRFAAKSTPSANRWFSFNALRQSAPWTGSGTTGVVHGDFYIDAAQISDAPVTDELPIKKPDLPNNHFDYMLTWYSFALILSVIYLILHIRGGRLRFGRSN